MSAMREVHSDCILPFAGYLESAVQPGKIIGVKPYVVGPLTIRIGYIGTGLIVDMEVAGIRSFTPRAFPQVVLSPDHPEASTTVHYTIANKPVRAQMRMERTRRLLHLEFTATGSFEAYFTEKKVVLPYAEGARPT